MSKRSAIDGVDIEQTHVQYLTEQLEQETCFRRKLQEEVDSWQRVCERLEGENLQLRGKVSDLIKILENAGAVK